MNRSRLAAAVGAAVSGLTALALVTAAIGGAPERAGLKVESTPAGASVFVAGEFRGVTPLELTGFEQGTYPVRLELGGHLPLTTAAEVAPPTRTLALEMTRAPSGSIRVASVPSGAEVFYEGFYRGVTPLLLEDLAVGDHQIRVEKANHHPWAGRVRVEDGTITDVAPVLADRILEFLEHALRENKSDILRNMEYAHHLFVRGEDEAAAAAYGDGMLLSREQILDLSREIKQATGDELRALREVDQVKKEEFKKLERQMQRDAQSGSQDFRRMVELERAKVQALFPQTAQVALNEAAKAEREGDVRKAFEFIERGIYVLGSTPPLEEKLAIYRALLENADGSP